MDKIISDLEAGRAVVTATPQQARHLRWRYGRRQLAQGREAWPAPQIQLLSAWVEQTWEASLVAGGAGARARLLGRAQARRLWSQVVARDVEPSGPLLQLVEQAWRLVNDWRIPLGAVARLGRGTDAERFAGWARGYTARCREAGWADSVSAMAALHAEFAGGAAWLPPGMHFVGFETWTPALDELARGLTSGGCPAAAAAVTITPASEPRRLEFDTESAETADAVAWTVAAARDQGACCVLVVPEPELAGPALRRVLLDAAQPDWRERPLAERLVTGGERRTLAECGPVHAALASLALCAERADYRVLGQLLRSPYLGDAAAEAAGRARLDIWLRERGGREWPIAMVREGASALAPCLARRLQAAAGTPPAGSRSPASWAAWMRRHLDALGWPGKAAPDADDRRAIRAWHELLHSFARCGVVTGDLGFGAARRLLATLAREAPGPQTEHGGGLQVLGPAEALGQQFESLWLAQMHAVAWPRPMRPNPLVPLGLQREAGVPAASPASHAAHERRLISQLCRAAGTAIISASHRRGDELLTPAPALGHIPRGAPAELVTRHPAAVTEQLAWRGEFEAMADPPPAVGPEETVRGGTRLLQLEAQCPARAFFELRLHARELRVPAFGIDALTRGELVHDALQALYQALREAGIEPGAAAARGLVPAIAEASLRGRLPPSRLNQVLEELEARRLASLLEAMLEFDARRAPFQVVATELPLDVPVAGLVLRVRADRVDELTDGSRLIIDYKTGVAKRRSGWLGERPAEPQLPLYALGGQADGVAFVYLNENGVTADGVAATDAEMQGLHAVGDLTRGRLATWEELAGEWSTALAMLAKEFLAGCCRIDADAPELADGQYAPLSRLHDPGVRP